MDIRPYIERLKQSAAAKNYSHMTITQIVSMLISICIYPYVIRKLGSEVYGLYVFGLSITNYFIELTSFGLKFPAVKAVVEYRDNSTQTNHIVTCIYVIKGVLVLLSSLIFILLTKYISFLQQHALILYLVFIQLLGEWLMPNWFYQGRQKMQVITYTSVGCRLLSVPAIFICIQSPNDITSFVLINTLSIVVAAIAGLIMMMWKEKVRFVHIRFSEIKTMIKDAVPFFGSNVIGVIKTETATLLIGTFLGMREVAIYDLANKLVVIPRTFTQNINHALFPSVLASQTKRIKQIIRYEYFIGLAIMLGVAAVGYWATLFLGGKEMLGAYPIAVILSVSILTWLVVGAYIAFVFVPQKRYYDVTRNQIVALISFLIIGVPGVILFKNTYALAIAFAISGLCEILYCKYITYKHQLI